MLGREDAAVAKTCLHTHDTPDEYREESVHSKSNVQGLPGGPLVGNPPANIGAAAAGHGFNSWFGKIPHAMEQLSPCSPTPEH